MPYRIEQRRLVLTNTDPQRRCYDGCHASFEMVWTDWDWIEWAVSRDKVTERLNFWRGLSASAEKEGREKSEYRAVWHDPDKKPNEKLDDEPIKEARPPHRSGVNLLTTPHVCVQAWNWDANGMSKIYTSDEDKDGWAVYLRGPTIGDGSFDMSWELDFLEESAALAYAASLAIRFETIIEVV